MGLLLGSRRALLAIGSDVWASYITSLAPLLWLRLRETTGSTAVNSGSGGSSIDGTATSCTLGQTGKLGANEAYLFDGAASRVVIANHASLANLTTQELVFLSRPTGAGEGNNGTLFNWGDGFHRCLYSAGDLQYRVDLATDAQASLSGGLASMQNNWSLLFLTFNDTTKVASIMLGISGAVGSPSSNTGSGAYAAPTGLDLYLGNRLSNDRTFAGTIDETLIFSRQLTGAERTQLVQLAGV